MPDEQLQGLLADPAAAEAYFEPRHVLDLVQTFWQPWREGQSLPVPEFLATLRPLIPRLYSISSSPLENPQRVQASLLRARCRIGWKGLCSFPEIAWARQSWLLAA